MNTAGSPSTVATPLNADAPLPDNVPVLQAMIRELLDTLKKSRHECEGVQQRLDLLLRKLYGPKAERFDANQPWLLPELAPAATTDTVNSPTEESPTEEESADTAKPKRKGHGRTPYMEAPLAGRANFLYWLFTYDRSA